MGFLGQEVLVVVVGYGEGFWDGFGLGVAGVEVDGVFEGGVDLSCVAELETLWDGGGLGRGCGGEEADESGGASKECHCVEEVISY